MKKLLLLLCFIPAFQFAFAQESYVVQLTDKNNSGFSASRPSGFLSPKSLARRAKSGIKISEKDIPVNRQYIESVAAAGVKVTTVSKWLNSMVITTNDEQKVTQIKNLPFVKNVFKVESGKNNLNKFGTVSPLPKRNTSYLKTQALNYGQAYDQVHMINLDVLHNLGYQGDNMVIAVLDAGFSNADTMVVFDSLYNNNRILGTKDFVDGDNFVYESSSHGTMVLSIMGGNWPGEIVGTAPHASYWLLRSEDTGSETIVEEYNWAAAAEFADSVGADVINSSLGYTEFDISSQNHVYADLDGNTTPVTIAADIAASVGILVCNSAGNEGSNSWNYISAPADADSILGVGAVDVSEQYASFSGNGPSADGRVKPDVAALGAGTTVALTGFVFQGNGTSFSSPVIAGASACLWQAFPLHNNMQVISAIKQSAHQFNTPDTLLGYGIPDFSLANALLSTGLTLQQLAEGDQIIHYYPNPFQNEITVEFFSDTKQEITFGIYDLVGKKCFQSVEDFDSKQVRKISMSPFLSKGIYFLVVKSQTGTEVRKLIRH